MEFCALASGSSGNCFYVKEGDSAILIDAGISAKQITERLSHINQSPELIEGIFVTHEHIDHIRGIDVFARRYGIPIYITKGTLESSFVCRDEELLNVIKNNECIKINGLNIEAFSKSHDAADPVSYSIEAKDRKLSVITDIGFGCKSVIEHVECSDSLILESNHDIDMLQNGPYPAYLKQRIASDLGHISNYDASLLVLEHAKRKMNNIVLSHLSENNNKEEIALKTMKSLLKNRKDLKNLKICISGRHKPTKLISI